MRCKVDPLPDAFRVAGDDTEQLTQLRCPALSSAATLSSTSDTCALKSPAVARIITGAPA